MLYVWTVSHGFEPKGSDLPTSAPSCEVLLWPSLHLVALVLLAAVRLVPVCH
jgi:hypothetical protein